MTACVLLSVLGFGRIVWSGALAYFSLHLMLCSCCPLRSILFVPLRSAGSWRVVEMSYADKSDSIVLS